MSVSGALNRDFNHLIAGLDLALEARSGVMDERRRAALRLYSGFYEGFPQLAVDLYAKTLVLYDYSRPSETAGEILEVVQAHLLERLAWVECVVQKCRALPGDASRRGIVSYGKSPDRQIEEYGVRYAIDLLMNQDASFYLDTRHLRHWLLQNAAGWRVLNLFAYTGSLGVAALSGGARQVIQVDRNRRFLDVARRSAILNRLDLGKTKLQSADFFNQVAHYKRSGELFDLVVVDPPFFSTTQKGTINLVGESVRVINKVRPLVRDGGLLVAINNALFLSGEEYMRSLEKLCQDGYLSVETLIPVPQDICGYPHTIIAPPPSDPAPFNHPTKIAVLRVRRN
ncbi:MAG: class I SAM-dependent methyltransferase [Anaerolineales bacterium]|nr:class I SAM-dependent methyltransferase [Anaerolineales bacterium]